MGRIGSSSAAVAVTVALILAFVVNGTVNQSSSLEEVFVSILRLGTALDKVDMFSLADIDGRAGFAAKFVVMPIGEIGAEFDFVHMGFPLADCLAGDGGKSVVVTFVAASGYNGAAEKFMNMLLVIILRRGTDSCGFHINFSFFLILYSMTKGEICYI